MAGIDVRKIKGKVLQEQQNTLDMLYHMQSKSQLDQVEHPL